MGEQTVNVSSSSSLISAMGSSMHNPGHVSRTVWVSKKYPDYVLVSVGSNANIDLPSFEARSGRAQIRAFDLRGLPTNGLPYTRYARPA